MKGISLGKLGLILNRNTNLSSLLVLDLLVRGLINIFFTLIVNESELERVREISYLINI